MQIIAYHGTYFKFNEFKYGDLGFHFSRDINIARNRLLDVDVPDNPDYPLGKILKVELEISNPYHFKCDMDDWNPSGIFKRAIYKITGKPFESPTSLYLIEQKHIASEAYKFLSKLGYSKNSIITIENEMKTAIDIDGVNERYVKNIKERLSLLGYDSISYENEYECNEDNDPLCYVALFPNQIKIC